MNSGVKTPIHRILKVKTKDLQHESRAIRSEEKKALSSGRWLKERQKECQTDYMAYNLLNIHRTREVRDAARATFLARAYIDGKDRSVVEKHAFVPNPKSNDRFIIKGAHMHRLAATAWSMISRHGLPSEKFDKLAFYEWLAA